MNVDLLRAIVRQGPEGADAWRKWRQSLGAFEDLTYSQLVLLPLLGRRLSQWTADDPEGPRFRGIVRMAWTRLQMQLQAVAATQRMLGDAGIMAAVTGPAALALRAEPCGAVRVIPHYTMMVARHQLPEAISILERDEWASDGWVPSGEALDWLSHVRLNRGLDVLYLHWRIYPAVFHQAQRAEETCMSRTQEHDWNHQPLRVVAPEDALLERVTAAHPDDPVPVEADLSLFDLNSIDWPRVRDEVRRHGLAPNSRHPLAVLRSAHRTYSDLAIPAFSADECAERTYRLDRLWQEFSRQCAYRGRPANVRGFAVYLSGGARRELQRWQRRLSWK
jgi:hypothetical protein